MRPDEVARLASDLERTQDTVGPRTAKECNE
jgi:hypothetical protein